MSAQASRALVVVDGSRALEGNDLASAWVLRRLAALDPVVIVTSTVAGPNEEAARFAYDRDIRLALYETTGRISGTVQHGRWTDDEVPAKGAPSDVWVDWFNRRAIVMASHAARRADRYGVTLLSPRSSATHTGKSFPVLICRAFGLSVEEMAWDGAA